MTLAEAHLLLDEIEAAEQTYREALRENPHQHDDLHVLVMIGNAYSSVRKKNIAVPN